MMSSMKFRLKSSPQHRLLTRISMEYRQVPIWVHLPSSVWWLSKIVPLLKLLLRNLLPVRKNKTSSSLIFTFCSFSTPDVMSIWINSFTTPLSTSSKILIQLYRIPCSFRFSHYLLYFTSLKISWNILEVSLLADTINSFIISPLTSLKFWRTFNSLRHFENWLISSSWRVMTKYRVVFSMISFLISSCYRLVITNLKTFIEVL